MGGNACRHELSCFCSDALPACSGLKCNMHFGRLPSVAFPVWEKRGYVHRAAPVQSFRPAPPKTLLSNTLLWSGRCYFPQHGATPLKKPLQAIRCEARPARRHLSETNLTSAGRMLPSVGQRHHELPQYALQLLGEQDRLVLCEAVQDAHPPLDIALPGVGAAEERHAGLLRRHGMLLEL